MSNGMQLLGVDQSSQSVVRGLMLLLAVAFDVDTTRRAGTTSEVRSPHGRRPHLRPAAALSG